jgi:hypothetical protein
MRHFFVALALDWFAVFVLSWRRNPSLWFHHTIRAAFQTNFNDFVARLFVLWMEKGHQVCRSACFICIFIYL